MNFFIIPGNPPAIHFYELWRKEIEQQLPGAIGFSSDYPMLQSTSDSALFMNQVSSHHQKNFENFCSRVSGPVTILGHSLGAYFSLKLLNECDSKIENVILIHPFLRTPTERGKIILKTVSTFDRFSLLKNLILKQKRGLQYLAKDLMHVTEDELMKTFPIATHEWNIVGKDNSPLKIPSHHQKKISLYHTEMDTWCSPQVIQELKEQVQVYSCLEPHDFITQESYRLSLLKKILQNRE